MARNFWSKVKAEFQIWRIGALPGLVMIAAIVGARMAGLLQPLELMALDTLLRLRPTEPVDERILIVGIDEGDIRQVGTYPIPDRDIADLLQRLQTYQPSMIGLDIFRDLPVQPGHAELAKTFRTAKNLIAIERIIPDQSGFNTNPPPELPAEQIGFSDVVLDSDSAVRRSLLGATNPQGDYRFSLALCLAKGYLAQQGIELDNGIRDPNAMRFGRIELPRFLPNSGSYIDADAGGNQILLNFRNSQPRFRMVSLRQIKAGQVNPDWVRGRVVLIGLTALSVKDTVSSAAIARSRNDVINGVELHAHTISQIISAVLDQRPLLQVWSDGWEYAWIMGWGMLGISLGRFLRSPWKILLGLGMTCLGLMGICYGLLIWGWWIPLVPAELGLVLNGAGLAAALFYRYEQDLRSRLRERQFVIEHTFNAIHNGPLQTLAKLLRQAQEQDSLPEHLSDLQHLNRELRAVYEAVRQETLEQGSSLHLDSDRHLDLQAPLHEVLHEVYVNTLVRDFPYFKTLKVKIVKFEPIDSRNLTLEQKRGLCRFLEEALCNVGKYAMNATRLSVICRQENGKSIIRIIDNGAGIASPTSSLSNTASGLGTQQAQRLARQLRGQFRRLANQPNGTICELTWSTAKFWFW